ncbi:MAG: tetratricopeptide repeat protein [bacterium]|nr:tetratricopeptide repeat protein [bacterium]
MRKLLVLFVLLLWAAPLWAQNEVAEAYQRSYALESAQDYPRAAAALIPLWEVHPQGYTLNLRLGWLYYLQNKQANAIEHYTRAVQAYPLSLEARLGLSLPYLAQRRWSEAEQILTDVLKRDHYNFYGNLYLARVYRFEGKLELAETLLMQTLYLYPTNSQLLLEWGEVLTAQNKVEQGRQVLADLLVLDPENLRAKALLKVLAVAERHE